MSRRSLFWSADPMHRLPVLFVLVTGLTNLSADSYHESLVVKPLNDGKVLAHFKFRSVWDRDVAGVKDSE